MAAKKKAAKKKAAPNKKAAKKKKYIGVNRKLYQKSRRLRDFLFLLTFPNG
jgi:hypothetical protein